MEKLDDLDKKSEEVMLTTQEKELQVELQRKLKSLRRDEELKWR